MFVIQLLNCRVKNVCVNNRSSQQKPTHKICAFIFCPKFSLNFKHYASFFNWKSKARPSICIASVTIEAHFNCTIHLNLAQYVARYTTHSFNLKTFDSFLIGKSKAFLSSCVVSLSIKAMLRAQIFA